MGNMLAPCTRRNLSKLLLPPSTLSLPWPASLMAAATEAAGAPSTFHASNRGLHQCQYLAFMSSTSNCNTNKTKPIEKKKVISKSSFTNRNKWKKNPPRPASSGRVAYINADEKSRAQKPRAHKKNALLCSGCGVEIILHDDNDSHLQASKQAMASGIHAVSESRSKRLEKKARYADVLDSHKTNLQLCQRCQHLQQNDIWNAYDALKDVDASVFSNQLSHIVNRRRFGLCVVVVDATDAEFSAVRKLRNIIGRTPCILVINKIDLLPRANGRDVAFLGRQIQKIKHSPKMIDTYAISSSRGWGMVSLAEGILKHIAGRDVFVIGSANVGKSTLVKNLSSLMARTLRLKGQTEFRQRRDALKNLNVTSSHLPGTTLQAIRIPCFPSSHHALWDTPGIIHKGSLVYSLFPCHLMEPLARPSRMGVPSLGDGTRIRAGAGESILIEAGWVGSDSNIEKEESFCDRKEAASFTLARLDVTEDGGVPIDALAFVPLSLKIRVVPTANAPIEASVPEEYIDQVERRVGMNGIFDRANLSKPLVIYKGDGLGVSHDGHVSFDVEHHAQRNGWINQDIVFASLGFIMLCHRQSFTVRPWVVQDSRYLKRPSLYPSNLENRAHTDDNVLMDDYDASMSENDARFKDIQERLRMAYDTGRKLADERENQKNSEEDYSDYDFEEDWWSHSQ